MISDAVQDRSDLDCFNGIVGGNRKDFKFLFHKYYRPLCDYARIYADSSSDAEDIVQDAFVYLWKNRKKINLEKDIKSYLFTSVKHEALNIMKHKAMQNKLSPSITEYWENLMNCSYNEKEQQLIQRIQESIDGLPDQCRKVFRMSCLDCMTYKEISTVLNISTNTVKTHISKAYRILRRDLDSDLLHTILYLHLFRKYRKGCTCCSGS